MLIDSERLVAAYILGYTATTAPRIASICARYVSKRLKQKAVEAPKNEDAITSENELLHRLITTIRGGFRMNGFAMVCGIPMATYLELTPVIVLGGCKVLETILESVLPSWSGESITFVSSFTSSFLGMTFWRESQPSKRTVDLTLAALVRAIDVLVQNLWRTRKTRPRGEMWWRKQVDTIVFATSCTIIMFAWFYAPERLPKYDILVYC